jgi:hypothetical protein
MATRTAITQPQTGLLGEARTMKAIGGRTAILTTDNVTGNIVEAFIAPAGFTVTGIAAAASDLDAGTNAMTISVGDAGSGTRFLSASTIGQAGTNVVALATTGVLFTFTADTKILITFTLGATVPAAGTIDLYLLGFNAS